MTESSQYTAFPVVVPDYPVLKHIYPTMQKEVCKIIKFAEETPDIQKVVIFGSSVRWDCRPDSDIDICIWLTDKDKNMEKYFDIYRKMYRVISLDFQFDFLYYDDLVSKDLKNEINTKGVTVFERPVQEN